MGSSVALYRAIITTLRRSHPTTRITQLTTWAWVVVGLIQTRSVHLSTLATALPSRAHAAGRVARLRRWLANPRLDVHALYAPLIGQVLTAWRSREVTVMLDGCFVHHQKLQLVRLSLSHCYRALPLVWTVTTSTSSLTATDGAALLERAVPLLAPARRVTFLADRGFRDTAWARLCQQHGWDYVIRLANSTTITYATGRKVAIDQMVIHPTQPRYLMNVRVTTEAKWPCNVVITWTRATAKAPAELCAVMTNLPPTKWVLNHYLKRMHIEQSFRDDKSGSFDMEATKLTDPARLDRLLLAIAVAVLWIYALGEQVLRGGTRQAIDPAYKRQLSVFQLGWRWLQRALMCATVPAMELVLHPFKAEPVWRGGNRQDGDPPTAPS